MRFLIDSQYLFSQAYTYSKYPKTKKSKELKFLSKISSLKSSKSWAVSKILEFINKNFEFVKIESRYLSPFLLQESLLLLMYITTQKFLHYSVIELLFKILENHNFKVVFTAALSNGLENVYLLDLLIYVLKQSFCKFVNFYFIGYNLDTMDICNLSGWNMATINTNRRPDLSLTSNLNNMNR